MGRQPNTSARTVAVLAIFSTDPAEWRYGYELGKSSGLKSGTLYPLLIRLHRQGLLEADWRPSAGPGRPPRHAYRLTAAGLALARSRCSAQEIGFPIRLADQPT